VSPSRYATLASFRPTSPISSFCHRLAVFSRFRFNTRKRTCPCHVKRRLPIFARRHPFPRFRPSLAVFRRFRVTRGNVRVRVKLSDACLFSPVVARFHVFTHRIAIFRRFRCNKGQRTYPHNAKRRLPILAQCRLFPRFLPTA
jgi:hypothetical protein